MGWRPQMEPPQTTAPTSPSNRTLGDSPSDHWPSTNPPQPTAPRSPSNIVPNLGPPQR